MDKDLLLIGCDEAGRGPLAGPVTAGAVILPYDCHIPLLRDSKKLTSLQREKLVPLIKKEAIAWAIGEASPREIDEHNILEATFLAMHRAIEELVWMYPDVHLLIDGNRFKSYLSLPYTCIVGGDDTVPAISAASVLAKTYRDRRMKGLAVAYPGYGWERNMGYPTREHRKAIIRLGCTPHHRYSFKQCAIAHKNHLPHTNLSPLKRVVSE